jgi:hypothetical protein
MAGNGFPTLEQVEEASHEQLARWCKFLAADTPEEDKILDRIVERFEQLGGMTEELDKRIGYGGV